MCLTACNASQPSTATSKPDDSPGTRDTTSGSEINTPNTDPNDGSTDSASTTDSAATTDEAAATHSGWTHDAGPGAVATTDGVATAGALEGGSNVGGDTTGAPSGETQAAGASSDSSAPIDVLTSDAPVVATCQDPFLVTCGARLNHDTRVHGQANQLNDYGCTARSERGPEAVYHLEGAAGCDVEVRLTSPTVDLDLFAVAECEAGFAPGQVCSSTPLDIGDTEQLSFVGGGEGTALLVVDGYGESAGAYALEIDCVCP